MTTTTTCQFCGSAVTSDDLLALRMCDGCCWLSCHMEDLEMLMEKSGPIGRFLSFRMRVRMRKIAKALKDYA